MKISSKIVATSILRSLQLEKLSTRLKSFKIIPINLSPPGPQVSPTWAKHSDDIDNMLNSKETTGMSRSPFP